MTNPEKRKKGKQLTLSEENAWHPLRTCLGCRKIRKKEEMIRIVRLPDGHLEEDLLQKMSGRGAYICRDPGCLKKAIRTRGIQRSLKADLTEELKYQLFRTAGPEEEKEDLT